MIAKLVLTSGSHAGLEEPLKLGYYLIGRHGECQIRPKSHSVSRRHCLLHHTEDGLTVFDLGSTNGTRVNNQRMEPNQWMRLRNRDHLKCGNVTFDVSIRRTDDEIEVATQIRSPNESKSNPLKEFDIVAFLDAEDALERRQRICEPKGGREFSFDAESIHDDEQHEPSHGITSIDAVGDDQEAQETLRGFRGGEEGACENEPVSPRARRIAEIKARIQEEREQQIVTSMNRNAKIVGSVLPTAPPKNKPAPIDPASQSRAESPERVWFYVTLLIASVTLVVFTYSVYEVYSDSRTRVVEGID